MINFFSRAKIVFFVIFTIDFNELSSSKYPPLNPNNSFLKEKELVNNEQGDNYNFLNTLKWAKYKNYGQSKTCSMFGNVLKGYSKRGDNLNNEANSKLSNNFFKFSLNSIFKMKPNCHQYLKTSSSNSDWRLKLRHTGRKLDLMNGHLSNISLKLLSEYNDRDTISYSNSAFDKISKIKKVRVSKYASNSKAELDHNGYIPVYLGITQPTYSNLIFDKSPKNKYVHSTKRFSNSVRKTDMSHDKELSALPVKKKLDKNLHLLRIPSLLSVSIEEAMSKNGHTSKACSKDSSSTKLFPFEFHKDNFDPSNPERHDTKTLYPRRSSYASTKQLDQTNPEHQNTTKFISSYSIDQFAQKLDQNYPVPHNTAPFFSSHFSDQTAKKLYQKSPIQHNKVAFLPIHFSDHSVKEWDQKYLERHNTARLFSSYSSNSSSKEQTDPEHHDAATLFSSNLSDQSSKKSGQNYSELYKTFELLSSHSSNPSTKDQNDPLRHTTNLSIHSIPDIDDFPNSNCSLNDSCPSPPHAPTFQPSTLIKGLILCSISAISFISNMVTLTSILKTRLHATSTVYMLLCQLTIADLLVTVFCMLAEGLWTLTVQWLAGDVLCKAVKFAQMFSLYLSTFVLVLIGFDRLWAVRYPMQRARAREWVRKGVVLIWVLSGIFSAPQVKYPFLCFSFPLSVSYSRCLLNYILKSPM